MLRRFHPVLACAAALTATAAMAQTAPPVAGVTVPGTALTKENAPKLAFDFVQAYTASTVKIQQVPRWHDPICIQVLGLAAAQAGEVKGRIEEVAKDVGISAGTAGCTPNVEVVFTTQPQKIVDDYAKGKEWILGYYYNDSKTRVVTQPIQAWYVTATQGGAGSNAMAFAYTGSIAGSGTGTGTQGATKVIDSPNSYTPTGTGDSKFTSNLQSVFANVFIVVDTSKAQGKSVGVLSDYVSMLALSEPRSLGGGCRNLPSVTDLFSGGCGGAQDGLSATDAAYLTALYQANPEARNVSEESDISDRMARMLVAR